MMSTMANMMRQGTLQKAIETYVRSTDPTYKSLGKELAAGTKKFKMLRDDILRRALQKFEPTIFSPEKVQEKKDILDHSVLLNLLTFALNVADDTPLPTDFAALRFENGLIELMKVRYDLMGKRLRSYSIGDDFGYFLTTADNMVTTAIPHKGGAANRLTMNIPSLGDEDDWQVQNMHSHRRSRNYDHPRQGIFWR